MKTGRFFYYGKYVVLGIAGLFLFAWVVMLLWNALIPDLFKGPEVTYGQTFGLLILSKILFSGIGKGGQMHHHPLPPPGTRRSDYYREHWRKRFESKVNGVTEEEGKSE